MRTHSLALVLLLADALHGCAQGDVSASPSLGRVADAGSYGPTAPAAPGEADADGADAVARGERDGSAPAGDPEPSCDNPPPPAIDPNLLRSCPDCAGARCVPRSIVAAQASAETLERLGACDAANVCLPDAMLVSGGFYRPANCESWASAEGRCLSACLPEVAAQRDILPQGRCGEHERCVPCFDPRTGAETGACNLACDPGPEDEAPPALDTCCDGAGLCVPRELVPAQARAALPRDTCGDAEALCAPAVFVTPGARAEACRSVGDAEGRCLPTCLPKVAEQTLLPRSSCAEAERCVPCTDPIEGKDTGACSIQGDAPREPPVRFDAACCGTHGLCVPKTLAGSRANELPVDVCERERGEGWVCAPRRVVEDPSSAEAPFESCQQRIGLFNVGRGKCVPRCMVESRGWVSSVLGRGTCERGALCVPCSVARDLPGC